MYVLARRPPSGGLIVIIITETLWKASIRFWREGFLGVAQPAKPASLYRGDAGSDPALPASALDSVARVQRGEAKQDMTVGISATYCSLLM